MNYGEGLKTKIRLQLQPGDLRGSLQHEEALMLAGTRYREYIVGPIEDQNVPVHIPMAGMGLGEQLRFPNGSLSP